MKNKGTKSGSLLVTFVEPRKMQMQASRRGSLISAPGPVDCRLSYATIAVATISLTEEGQLQRWRVRLAK